LYAVLNWYFYTESIATGPQPANPVLLFLIVWNLVKKVFVGEKSYKKENNQSVRTQ